MTSWRPAIGDERLGPHPYGRAYAWLLVWALLWRFCYLAQYLELPFLFGPVFDSPVYLLQARRIAEGRFADPTLLAFSPLYGWFLALLGAHQGSILPVLVQLALGLLNLALLRSTTRHLFGELAALCAVVLGLGYGPLLFFETKIMSETLGFFLLWSTLALIYRPSFARAELRVCCASGALMALAVLARASLLPAAPLLALAVALLPAGDATMVAAALPSTVQTPAARPARVGLRRTLWFSLALLSVLSLHGGWNRLQSGLFVPVILVSETAARASQKPWSEDLSIFRARPDEPVGAFSVVAQASRRLLRHRRGQPEPSAAPFDLGGYFSQLPHKLWLSLRDGETSFDYGYYGERTEIWSLWLAPVSFGLLLALAAFGLLGAVQNRRLGALAPLFAVTLGTLLTTTLFHPSTRYRLPLVVLLLPLAGYAFQLAREIRLPSTRRFAWIALCALCAVFAVVQATMRPLAQPALWQLRVAESALEEGNFGQARQRLWAAQRLAPGDSEVSQRVARLSRRFPVPVKKTQPR